MKKFECSAGAKEVRGEVTINHHFNITVEAESVIAATVIFINQLSELVVGELVVGELEGLSVYPNYDCNAPINGYVSAAPEAQIAEC